MGVFYCCVRNCPTGSNSDKATDKISLFRFPKHLETAREWVRYCNREDLINYPAHHLHNNFRVCALHFEDRAFAGLFKIRLKKGAVPTKQLTQGSQAESQETSGNSIVTQNPLLLSDPLSCASTSIGTQTATPLNMSEPGPSNAEEAPISFLIKEEIVIKTESDGYVPPETEPNMSIKQEDLHIKDEPSDFTMEKNAFLEFCEGRLSKGLLNFVSIHLGIRERDPVGYESSSEYKMLCLTIYFMCPQAYKLLSQLFGLSSKITLYSIVNDWNITSGFNEQVFELLNPKVRLMGDIERDCCLSVGKMSLRRFLFYNRRQDRITGFHECLEGKTYMPARSVLVLMIRSISNNWIQPVASYFVDTVNVKELRIIVRQTVRRLLSIGLNVVTLNCRLGVEYRKFAKILNITDEKPFFMVGDKKVYFMYDVPDLLNCLWKALFKYQLKVGHETADKQYIELLYENDKLYRIRLVPKLTDDHIHPTNSKKIDVTLPAQVLSARVAAAISTYVALGVLPREANFTAIFVDNMDKLFDIFNSRNKTTRVKEFNKPFMGIEEHITFLGDMLELFQNVEVYDSYEVDVTKEVKFVEGWRVTIKSFLLIWEDLKESHPKLFTRHFNQECLRDFFEKVRQRCGSGRNPTPYRFERTFKRLFCSYYFKYSTESNNDDDADDLLRKLTPETIESFKCLFPQKTVVSSLDVNPIDYLDIEVPDTQALFYISGFLLGRTLRRHSCSLCVKFVKGHDMSAEEFDSCLQAYKAKHARNFGQYLGRPENILELVYRLEIKFCEIFTKLSVKDNVAVKLKDELSNVQLPEMLCNQFDINYLLSLYVRMRIFFSLKFVNKNLTRSRHNELTIFKSF